MEYFFNFNKLEYLKGKRPGGCILCLVSQDSDEVENLIVHEQGTMLVSLNLYPYNPGHLLIFPKRHCVDVRQLSDEERTDLFATQNRCLDVLDSIFKPAGYNIGFNMGLIAGASIEHLHMHIIPRYSNEIGIAELLGGKKVLVQNPLETRDLLLKTFSSGRA